jgi:hypothetical protein
MKMTNEALKIVTPEDAEQTRNPLPRLAGLPSGEELDPSRLMDLLGAVDNMKREIHERMRRIDAVNEAKSLLMDEAQRTETLNHRVAEMSKLMKAIDSGALAADASREAAAPSDMRVPASRISGEVAIAWPKSQAPREPLAASTTQEFSSFKEVPVLTRSAFEESEAVAAAASLQITAINELLRQGEQSLLSVQTLLAETQAGYKEASIEKERTAAEFRAIQQELRLAYAAANVHLAEAEEHHREAAEKSANTKSKVENAELALAEARVREETAASELQSARQELTTAYQFASVAGQRRLESSELFERTARWAVFASLFSWVATVWMGWIALIGFHRNAPVLLPILGSIILVLGGMVLIKRRVGNSEDR